MIATMPTADTSFDSSTGIGFDHSSAAVIGNSSNIISDRIALMRWVCSSIAMATATMQSVFANEAVAAGEHAELLGDKVLAETAMLLVAVAPLRGTDRCLDTATDQLATMIAPYSRRPSLLAGVCLQPGAALEQAAAHVMLTSLGYPDPLVAQLLATSIRHGNDRGPERLPHRSLELEWLKRMLAGSALSSAADAPDHLASCALGRPMDVLHLTKSDVYAFTHAVMYATDLGGRRLVLPRTLDAVVDDAAAALAFSLDAVDYDLTAEVLMTWPMLGVSWSLEASLAFGVLATVYEEFGFLPGGLFEIARYRSMDATDRARYAQATSYHSTFVMGILCAALLRAPQANSVPETHHDGALHHGAAVLSILELAQRSGSKSESIRLVQELRVETQAPLAGLALAALLRNASVCGDLATLQEALGIALRYDMVDGPAVAQASELLQRCAALARATSAE